MLLLQGKSVKLWTMLGESTNVVTSRARSRTEGSLAKENRRKGREEEEEKVISKFVSFVQQEIDEVLWEMDVEAKCGKNWGWVHCPEIAGVVSVGFSQQSGWRLQNCTATAASCAEAVYVLSSCWYMSETCCCLAYLFSFNVDMASHVLLFSYSLCLKLLVVYNLIIVSLGILSAF